MLARDVIFFKNRYYTIIVVIMVATYVIVSILRHLGEMRQEGELDETKADEYIGKTVLVGIYHLDHNEKLLEKKEWHGVIETFSSTKGIIVKLHNSNETFTLPPDIRGIRKADPGTYRLKLTGEEVENPYYLAEWDVVKPPPDEVDPKRVGDIPFGLSTSDEE